MNETEQSQARFVIWWERETAKAHYFGSNKHEETAKELCRIAWENGQDKQTK
tara:strand:- start:1079 stop:1234 length:156 start_codon:yes stop_codon:yes gene_type:complete